MKELFIRFNEPSFICFSLYSSSNSFENNKFFIDKTKDIFFFKFAFIKISLNVFENEIKIIRSIK